jgi:integrase
MASAKYKLNNRGYYETKVWDGTYTSTGAKHRKTLTSKKSSADLEKKVNAYRRQLEENDVAEINITFGEYSRKWFDVYKQTKELNTKKMYKTCVDKYLSPLDDIRLVDLKHSHFQQIINENSEYPKTCKNIKLTFTQIVRSAVRDHYLPHNALDDITMDISLPKYIKPQKRALLPLEKRAMMEADLDQRKRAFVTVLYYCGLRRGEALALTVDDFDWQNKTVRITKVIVFDKNTPILKPYPKSDNGIRSVPLPEAAVSVLKPYVDNCEGYLFKGQNSPCMSETAYKRMWSSIITSMNVALGYNPQAKKDRMEKPIQGLTAHIFRHNYCTQLCYQIPAISTKKIAQLMGDTEKVVLGVYSHMLDEKENVSDAINNAF